VAGGDGDRDILVLGSVWRIPGRRSTRHPGWPRRLQLAVSRGWIIGDTASSRLLASRAPRGSL